MTTAAAADPILPHYFFLGWRATVNGARVPLGRDPNGLMLVRLPARAEALVEVRFRMTRMRAVGLGLFALAVAAWIAVGVWLQRRASPTGQPM